MSGTSMKAINEDELEARLTDRQQPILIITHTGDINAQIHMFVDYSKTPEKLTVNANSEYESNHVKNKIEEKYDVTDYYHMYYNTSDIIEKDQLGVYCKTKDIDNHHLIDTNHCIRCNKKTVKEEKAYIITNFHNPPSKIVCANCRSKRLTAEQL